QRMQGQAVDDLTDRLDRTQVGAEPRQHSYGGPVRAVRSRVGRGGMVLQRPQGRDSGRAITLDDLAPQDLDLRGRSLELAAGPYRVHADPGHARDDDHQQQRHSEKDAAQSATSSSTPVTARGWSHRLSHFGSLESCRLWL